MATATYDAGIYDTDVYDGPAPGGGIGTVASAELRVIVQGDRHRVWLNRRLLIDVEDAALNTVTDVGLYAKGSTATKFEDPYWEGL